MSDIPKRKRQIIRPKRRKTTQEDINFWIAYHGRDLGQLADQQKDSELNTYFCKKCEQLMGREICSVCSTATIKL